MELDDKKKKMERPRAGKKKFKVRWGPLYRGCYVLMGVTYYFPLRLAQCTDTQRRPRRR